MDKKSTRRVVQDIVTPTRPAIRRIKSVQQSSVTISRGEMSPKRPRGKITNVFATFVIVFIGLGIIAVALSLLYSKASVAITPKSVEFEISETLTTKKTSDASFGYGVVTATESLVQAVPATDGPLLESKAKGTIVLYNGQAMPQKIVAGTRLSNSKGLIYRTTTTVTIPQMKTSKIHGSIAVNVIADATGADYNMALSEGGEFKVVAYKGGPKYTTVYGNIKTSITGGFSGYKKVISDEAKKAAVQAAKETLKSKLDKEIETLLPADSIFFDNAATVEYEIADPVRKDAQTADISVKATLAKVYFKKTDLLRSVAGKELSKFSLPSYRIEGFEDLKFTLLNPKEFSAKNGTPLVFSLKGSVKLVGTFSETALKNELKGTYLKDSNAIFARYPAISNVYARITPFWMRYFPTSVDNIEIEVKD